MLDVSQGNLLNPRRSFLGDSKSNFGRLSGKLTTRKSLYSNMKEGSNKSKVSRMQTLKTPKKSNFGGPPDDDKATVQVSMAKDEKMLFRAKGRSATGVSI